MRYLICSLFFSCLLSTHLGGQSSFKWGGLGYGSLGVQNLSFSNAFEFADITDTYRDNFNFQFGGGGFLLLGSRYIFMGQGYGSVFSESTAVNSSSRPTFGGGGINFGYAVLNKGGLLAFPTIGIGGSGYILEVANTGENSIEFGSATIGQNETTSFQLGGSYLDLNVNVHKLFDFNKDDEDAGGVSLGFTMGYQLPLGESSWSELDSGAILQRVDSNDVGAFYVRFLIGGGGFKM